MESEVIAINEYVTVAAHEPLRPVRTGIWKRVIVDAPALSVDEIFFDQGVATDSHGHGLSQAAYQVSGKFEVRLADEKLVLGPGDGYSIPAGVEHSVRCVEKGSYILVTARGAGNGVDRAEHDHHDHGHDDHGHGHGQGHGH
ncbi:MAG TPA: cupin domain-containing protein [Candidatus Limnocylindrales bacterium]|jgi:quercetin dioxygenase-like cupin family protein